MRKFGNFSIEALDKLFDENRLVGATLVGSIKGRCTLERFEL